MESFFLYWILLILLVATYIKQGVLQNMVILSSTNKTVLENSSVALTCSNKSGVLLESRWSSSMYEELAACALVGNTCLKTRFLNTSALLNCSCNLDGTYTVILKHVDRFQHGVSWRCGQRSIESNTVVINVSVPVTHVILTEVKNAPMHENTSVTFNCTTSYSLPSARIHWYLSNGSSLKEITGTEDVDIKHETHTREDNVILVTETLQYKVNRSINGSNVYCTATNWQSKVASNNIELSVIYPPDRPPAIDGFSNGSTYKVIEKENASLSCSVTGGNPPAKSKLYCDRITNILSNGTITNNETFISFLSWITIRTDGKRCTCVLDHDLSNASIHVTIDVLYPPGIPTIQLQHKTVMKNVSSDAKLIEDKTYGLLCIADANPPPLEYIWDVPKSVNISYNNSVNLTHVKRSQNGTYTCHAQNIMRPTSGENCTKKNSSSVSLKILYKPSLAVINKQDVEEGTTLDITCEVISANPNVTSYMWTRDRADFNKNATQLLIQKVSRNDSMNYICTVKNCMTPTLGNAEEGYANESFYLNVWYKATVKRFVVNGHENDLHFETNETNIVTFICEIDSNPNSTATLITPNGTEIISTRTNSLKYSHFLSSCVDNGTYTCFGTNLYNKGDPGVATLPVFVKCTPMAKPNITEDVRSKLHVPVTLQFEAVAYPDPEFTWEQLAHASWDEIKNDEMFSISSSGLQSNLTIRNFTTLTANTFRVTVFNEIGRLNQTYSLKPFDRPTKPTQFRHNEDLLTDTSVMLLWKPGFNGGLTQTFVITYTDGKDKDRHNVTKQDTGNTVMNVTVRQLTSDTSYTFELFAENNEGRSGSIALQIKTKESATLDAPKAESQVGLVVGSISGVAFVTLGAVIGILVYKKRFSSSGKETESSRPVYQNVSFGGKSPKKKINHKVSSKKETSFQTLQELDDAPPIYKEPTEYYNSPDKIEQFERIKVSELLTFVLGSSEESFGIEYQKLPTDLQKPCVFARKPENIALNRYNGIYPYDHSRVKIPGMPDFFINACFIDGYAKQNEYVASLGPIRKATHEFKTFWIMVWSERSDIIVMLTNLREPSGMKCEQYWPELGTTETYGDIQVTSETEDVFAEYTTRSFIVSNSMEKRRVTHLHYTAWPDKKVPEDVTTLIEFRQRLQITPSTKKGPIIVHCSAGIGRTGTLIALDRLIQEGQCESSVDVFKCVNSMREQRVKMVQTLEQYIYIYKALVNSLYFDSEVIPIESFQEYVDQTNNNIYSRQFQQLKESVEKCGKEEHDARARNKMLVDKNRMDADIPGNQYRVYLYHNRNMDMSDYINAVYVSSFKRKDHFILAQSPLPDTVSDFVCMMYQENCCCVVTLEDLHEPGMSVGLYLPIDGQSQRFGDIKMSCRTLEMKPRYTVREIKMQNIGKIESQEKVAYHFQYNKWVPGNDTPADTKGFVQFIKNVEEYADQLGGENSHVLVHCLKANERSALYSIVTILTEKILYERQVSVLNTVRHLRTRRRTAITSMEQLKFCYMAVKAYIDMFES